MYKTILLAPYLQILWIILQQIFIFTEILLFNYLKFTLLHNLTLRKQWNHKVLRVCRLIYTDNRPF